MADRNAIFDAIEVEREYQDRKWGTIEENPHTVAEWVGLAMEEVIEADEARQQGNYQFVKMELVQAAAVIVAALEQHGVVTR